MVISVNKMLIKERQVRVTAGLVSHYNK